MKYLSRNGRNNLLQINRESPAVLSDQTFPPGEYAIMRAESWQNLNFLKEDFKPSELLDFEMYED